MLLIRFFISYLFLIIVLCFPQKIFADTTPYRSAGWVATDTQRTDPYTNLTGCQATDGIYCSHAFTPGQMNLYFSSFGTLTDFGMPQNAEINKVHIRVTGKNTVTQWVQLDRGKNRPLQNLCQSPFDLWQVYLGPTGSVKEFHTAFDSANFLATCFSPMQIDTQDFTFSLFFNGYNVNNWSADIDNFEIAFDYTILPTPTPTNTPTPTLTPTPTVTSTPTPTPTPTPSQQIVFVHGLTSSFRAVQAGTAEFKTLITNIPENNQNFFPYYQDSGYKLESGGCGDGFGDPQPTPDTNVGSLYAHPESIDPTICDSQSAIAYNATGIDNFLSSIQSQTTIINYSMGAAITHGWLTLAQSKTSDQALQAVDTVISLQGAYEGSYLARAGMYLLHVTNWANPLDTSVISAARTLWGIDASRPAENDLTPQSLWYQSANMTVPPSIHYFNFFSDIQVSARPQLFFVTLPPIGSTSFGDTVLLPGEDDPTALPQYGGARFLPNGQAEDRHEFGIARNYDIKLGDDLLNTVLPDPLSVAGLTLQITNDPATHFNLNNNLNSDVIKIDSCKNSLGQVTVQTEILRILADPAHACDL